MLRHSTRKNWQLLWSLLPIRVILKEIVVPRTWWYRWCVQALLKRRINSVIIFDYLLPVSLQMTWVLFCPFLMIHLRKFFLRLFSLALWFCLRISFCLNVRYPQNRDGIGTFLLNMVRFLIAHLRTLVVASLNRSHSSRLYYLKLHLLHR